MHAHKYVPVVSDNESVGTSIILVSLFLTVNECGANRYRGTICTINSNHTGFLFVRISFFLFEQQIALCVDSQILEEHLWL